jgi:hypothetical protein
VEGEGEGAAISFHFIFSGAADVGFKVIWKGVDAFLLGFFFFFFFYVFFFSPSPFFFAFLLS